MQYQFIRPGELKELLDSEQDFLLIDLRDNSEYRKVNIGGDNIPLKRIDANLEKIESYKNKPVIVCCSNKMSLKTGPSINKLKAAGFTNVKYLQHGLMTFINQNGKSTKIPARLYLPPNKIKK